MRNADFMPGPAVVGSIERELSAYNAERSAVHADVKRRLAVGFGVFAVATLAALVVAMGSFGGSSTLGAALGVVLVVAVMAGIALYAWAVRPATALQQALRDKLIPAAFGFIENVAYARGKAPDAFARMPKAAVGAFNRTTINDHVAGRYGDFAFDLFEARLAYKSGKSEQEMFKGIVMAFAMPRSFPGTVVATKTVGGVSRFFRDLFGKGGLQQVESGDPALDGDYEFRSDNPEAARPLVTGSFARALDQLRDAWPEAAARVALCGSDGFLLLPSKRNFFELPHVSQDCDYRRHVEPMVSDAAALLATAALVRRIA